MNHREHGFSLIELTIVAAIASILALVAAPGWVAFMQRQQLIAAQDSLYRVIQRTQQLAITQRVPWQVSFRLSAPASEAPTVEWTRHPSQISSDQVIWQPVHAATRIRIDEDASTLVQRSGLYWIQFDHHGYVSGRLGRLTLMGTQPGFRRCVVVSTRLGALRKGKEGAEGKGCD
ncbi:MAG: prepilin-type N-terminal cleavage/methylation domain-containing protein [Elainellaceae cyanobacterium]